MKGPTMYVTSQVYAEICLFNVVGGHFFAAILKIIKFQLNLAYLIYIRKTNILTYHTTF